ncbi:hypothetical protein [Asanoa siamensis]|uniref:Uncharacterized protein n=1 Tax=Asanoa siamensis TaxID=926357 RepID=A0ABQ4CL60_9ACTN|nr:hypothetical protein [Asanoa siamensis]GIF72016.1 hypothetical protein Asi02nite_15340 [Asanoa siamensis]
MRLDGEQHGLIQNADQIVNAFYAETRDWLKTGLRLLHEGLYREARNCFDDLLVKEAHDDGAIASERRMRAHAYAALAILAGRRPSYRSPDEVHAVVNHVVNARAVALATVIAALVRDDYFGSDGMTVPSRLDSLSRTADPRRLSRSEFALLATHTRPCRGPAWAAFAAEADRRGVWVDRYEEPATLPVASPERQIGVPLYFYPMPRKPLPPNSTPAAVRAGAGVLALVTPFVGVLDGVAWHIQLAIAGPFVVAAVLLFFFSVTAYRDFQTDRVRQREWEEAKAQTARRPSDRQMDTWLEDDVVRIAEIAARRHRLDKSVTGGRGGLIVEPQTAVGVSNLRRGELIERVGAGYRQLGRDGGRARTPLAKVRTGSDGKLRSDHYRIMVIFLTEQRVAVFECDLDFARRVLLTESTQTFHYDDVVSISSRTVSEGAKASDEVRIRFDDGSGNYATISVNHRFAMSLVSGERVEVGVGISGPAQRRSKLAVAWENARVERVVQRMVWSRKERRAEAA